MIPARGPQTRLKEIPGLSHHGDEQLLAVAAGLRYPGLGTLTTTTAAATGNPEKVIIGNGSWA